MLSEGSHMHPIKAMAIAPRSGDMALKTKAGTRLLILAVLIPVSFRVTMLVLVENEGCVCIGVSF